MFSRTLIISFVNLRKLAYLPKCSQIRRSIIKAAIALSANQRWLILIFKYAQGTITFDSYILVDKIVEKPVEKVVYVDKVVEVPVEKVVLKEVEKIKAAIANVDVIIEHGGDASGVDLEPQLRMIQQLEEELKAQEEAKKKEKMYV